MSKRTAASSKVRALNAIMRAKTPASRQRALRALDAVNARRKNPTKAQKREKAKKLSAKRRIAQALQNFVRKANPAAKGVVKATKVKGGWNVRVVDVRRNAGKRASAGWTVDAWHGGGGFFGTKKAAVAHAKRLREANRQAGNAGPVRVIRVASPDYMPPITHRGVRYR